MNISKIESQVGSSNLDYNKDPSSKPSLPGEVFQEVMKHLDISTQMRLNPKSGPKFHHSSSRDESTEK